MFKKIAIALLFLAVTAGVGYMLYRFFFSAPAAVTPGAGTGTQTAPGSGLPLSGTGRPTTPSGTTGAPGGLPTAAGQPAGDATAPGATADIVAGQAQSPIVDASGNLKYFSVTDGTFYRILPDGQTQALSSAKFTGADKIIWAPAGDKAAIIFPDNSKVIYDFTRQRQVTIPSHWQDITFSTDGSMIVAKSMALDPAARWLISAATDGTTAKLIEPLGENGDKVTVSVSPDTSVVAFSNTSDPVGFDTHDLLVIGQNHENFPAMRVEGFGFQPKWSPDGQRLLYSAAGQTSGYLPSLWVVDGSSKTVGGGRRSLNIRTWADKCAFQDADTLYCAVPDSLPQGAGLQPDIADNIADSIYKIDLISGSSSIIGRPATNTSMRSLTLSPDGSKAFFINALGTLQSINLR